jgi:hypothetical protein
LECLKKADQYENKTKEINTLIEILTDQDRVSNLDLFDFMRAKTSIVKQKKSEIIQPKNNVSNKKLKLKSNKSNTNAKPVVQIQTSKTNDKPVTLIETAR